MKIFSPPPPPTPTVHSNCKSVMAGRTNDRELLAWARSNKTPALRAIDEGPKLFEDTIDKHACWSSCKLWEHRPRVPDLVNSSPPPHPLNWSLNPLEETLLQPLQSYNSFYYTLISHLFPTHLTGLLIPLKKLFYSHCSPIIVSIQCNEGLENKLTRAPLLGLIKYVYLNQRIQLKCTNCIIYLNWLKNLKWLN